LHLHTSVTKGQQQIKQVQALALGDSMQSACDGVLASKRFNAALYQSAVNEKIYVFLECTPSIEHGLIASLVNFSVT